METINEHGVTPQMVLGLIDRTIREKGKDSNPLFKSLMLTNGKTNLTLNFRAETGAPSASESPWLANITGPIFIEDTREGNLLVYSNGEVRAYEASITDDLSTEVAYSLADYSTMEQRVQDWQPKQLAA